WPGQLRSRENREHHGDRMYRGRGSQDARHDDVTFKLLHRDAEDDRDDPRLGPPARKATIIAGIDEINGPTSGTNSPTNATTPSNNAYGTPRIASPEAKSAPMMLETAIWPRTQAPRRCPDTTMTAPRQAAGLLARIRANTAGCARRLMLDTRR